MTLESYEKRARNEIELFKNPNQGMFGRLQEAIAAPMDAMTDAAMATQVGEIVSNAVARVVETVNDGATFTVRVDAILADFRNHDCSGVERLEDISNVALCDIDRVVAGLDRKYQALAATEGALTGSTGIVGIAVDVPATIGLSLRAIAEYAAYYGFDPGRREERAFATQLLTVASAPSAKTRREAFAALHELMILLQDESRDAELDKLLSVATVRKVADLVAMRLTRMKIAQVVPVVGGVVGAGYNAWYLGQVCDAARMLYRERYLVDRHGPDAAVPVKGA